MCAINRIHEEPVRSGLSTCLHKQKKHSFDKLLTTNYFFNVIYLYLVPLLDFFYDFYFLGVGVNTAFFILYYFLS